MPAGPRDARGSLEHGRFHRTHGRARHHEGDHKLRRGLTLAPLVGIMYFTVCGGTFGIEATFGNDGSGPGLGLLLLFIMPLIFSIPSCSWSTR